MQKVANAGGINGDGVTKKTNYLVLGTTDYCAALKGEKSAKYKKAEALAQRGQDIQIISEDTFLEMLSTSACENASSSSTTSPAVNNAQPVLQDRDEKEYLNGLLPEMVSVIEKCGGDKNFLSITSTNSATYMKGDSASVKLGNMIVFRVKLHGKSKYVSVPTSMSTLIPSDFPRVSEATVHKFVKIIVDFKHPIEHYKDFLLQVLSESMNRYPSEWSCCSRYMECSDARSCVNPDKNIALACSYRKTLNSGRIFYGKNRNI